MVSNALLLVLGGCLLGALQLIVGVLIGLWARGPAHSANGRGRYDLQEASSIARKLRRLANEMATVVDDHVSELRQANEILTIDGIQPTEELPDAVMNVVAQIVQANQTLQSKLDHAEGRLQEQAVEIEAHISRSLTDPLTGLPNRREFNERLEERLSTWTRRKEVFSLLLIDVDHFKKLNDQYGHLAGDQVLVTLGTVLRNSIRREDSVARYGGEEFAVLLPNTNLAQAAQVAQKIRDAVSSAIVRHEQHAIHITVSGGLATIGPCESGESLIQRADEALYAAKAAGRNCIFEHDGHECLLADGEFATKPTIRASEIIELISARNSHSADNGDPLEAHEFGTFVGEGISSSLAATCQELRRCLEQRSQPESAPPANSA